MRKSPVGKSARFLLLLAFVLIATGSVLGNGIESEDIVIDLGESKVDAEIKVESLSSDFFTYITTNEIGSVNASIDGVSTKCDITPVTLGSEIRCEANRTGNYTVKMSYRTVESLVEDQGSEKIFRYQHPVFRPTDSYNLKVVLPEGTALAQEENISQIISPFDADINTDGRQISVSWSKKPALGEPLSFFVVYEDFKPTSPSSTNSYRNLVIVLIGVGLLGLISFLIRRRMNRENISKIFDEINEEQKEIIDLLVENEGEYLQKDVVNELDYSKAKISGIVSELVEEEYIKKTKEGRSNKLVISNKYSY